MKSVALILIIVTLSLSCGGLNAEVPAKTHDGRSGTACPSWVRHPEIQLCSPSIIRLVAHGEDYDERQISVSGRLVNSSAAIYLCPSLELCADGDWSSSIQLPSLPEIARLAASKSIPQKRVTIVGRFSATTRGKEGQVAGVFLSVDAAYFSDGP